MDVLNRLKEFYRTTRFAGRHDQETIMMAIDEIERFLADAEMKKLKKENEKWIIDVKALTRTLEERNAKIVQLTSQLPEGMKHCTIVCKRCEKGHGRLVAANWIDHGCPWCVLESIADSIQKCKDQFGGSGIYDGWISQ